MRKADVIFLRVAGLVWQLLLCTSSFALFPANDHRGHRGQRLCRRTGPCLADLTSSARPAALFIFLTSPSGRSCMTSMDTRGYRDVELTRPGAHSHRVAEPESTARHPVWTSEKDIWPLGRKHRARSAQRKVVWQKQPTNTPPQASEWDLGEREVLGVPPQWHLCGHGARGESRPSHSPGRRPEASAQLLPAPRFSHL